MVFHILKAEKQIPQRVRYVLIQNYFFFLGSNNSGDILLIILATDLAAALVAFSERKLMLSEGQIDGSSGGIFAPSFSSFVWRIMSNLVYSHFIPYLTIVNKKSPFGDFFKYDYQAK
jgi:hypothetical protein